MNIDLHVQKQAHNTHLEFDFSSKRAIMQRQNFHPVKTQKKKIYNSIFIKEHSMCVYKTLKQTIEKKKEEKQTKLGIGRLNEFGGGSQSVVQRHV